MRRNHVATALVLTAAVVATAAIRRFAGRRRHIDTALPTPVPAPAAPAPAEQREAVVLAFRRVPATPLVERPAAPSRCGDNGGRTKAGAPCAARATTGGRCHHHRLAA